jgi:hypothetical protein
MLPYSPACHVAAKLPINDAGLNLDAKMTQAGQLIAAPHPQ